MLVDHEAEHMYEEYQEATKTGRMSMEQYQRQIQWSGKSEEEIQAELRTEAEARIKRAVVLREITQSVGIEASEEDVDQEIELMAASAGQEADQLRKMFESEENRDSLRRSILNRKAVQHIAELADQKSNAKPKNATAEKTKISANPKAKKTQKKVKPKS